jgi:hypothetical protein
MHQVMEKKKNSLESLSRFVETQLRQVQAVAFGISVSMG